MFPVLQNLPDETLVDMGIPESALRCARIRYEGVAETVVGRFDFIVTPQGPKVIELNAETPFFYWESHAISGAIARSLGYADPNLDAESQLKAALLEAIEGCSRGGRVVVTAYTGDVDDETTASYAARLIDADFSPLSDLTVVPGEALYDSKGPIDVLYRFYPLELFAQDDGAEALFDLIRNDQLRIINPPCSLLLQNKCAHVLIWGLYEAGQHFNAEERAIIERVFLPTYADLPDDGRRYVRKPVFGRHGASVTYLDPDGSTDKSTTGDYDDQPMVYQLHAQLPKVSFRHPSGEQREGYAITTCFIAGGKPNAVCMRVGAEITDGWAHFLPLAYASAQGAS